MINASTEVELHVGDEVFVDSLNGQRGTIESMRVISEAQLVQDFKGVPSGVVLTVHIGDAVINVRGGAISLPEAIV